MSDKVHVHNHTLQIHSLPEGITLKPGTEENGVRRPGVTVVEAKAWEKAKKHGMVQAHLDEKNFSEGKLSPAEKKADIATEKAADAADKQLDKDRKADAKK
jgi:hypothetical protein